MGRGVRVCQGPPTSIQLQTGRIVVPTAFCYDGGMGRCKSAAPGDWFAATLYSDDFGRSFSVSSKEAGGNECQAAELSNGSLVLNQRTRGARRQLSYRYGTASTGWRAVVCCGVLGRHM
jgi:hypothetical protein